MLVKLYKAFLGKELSRKFMVW